MINTPTYMIMLVCGSTCIGSYLNIHVHVVAFEFLGKRWCRRVTLATSKKIEIGEIGEIYLSDKLNLVNM